MSRFGAYNSFGLLFISREDGELIGSALFFFALLIQCISVYVLYLCLKMAHCWVYRSRSGVRLAIAGEEEGSLKKLASSLQENFNMCI